MKQKIIAHAQTVTADDFAFTRKTQIVQASGATREERTVIEKFDPRQPADKRWDLVSIDGNPSETKQLAAYNKQNATRKVPHYGRVAEFLSETGSTRTDADGQTVFATPSLPKGTVVALGSDCRRPLPARCL